MKSLALQRCLVASAFLVEYVTAETTNFHVRNPQRDQTSLEQRHRAIFDLEMSFSVEGEAIDLPTFQLQIFPTAGNLTLQSELGMERALTDYLGRYFKELYPLLDDAVERSPEFFAILLEFTGMRPVTSNNTRRQRSLQRQGTEFDVQTSLQFIDDTVPAYQVVQANMRDAILDNFNEFLTSYLPFYTTPELSLVDSGNYIAGSSDPPSPSPTIEPTEPSGTVSQINRNVPTSTPTSWGINPIYPAVICGVVVFILTALALSYRPTKLLQAETEESDVLSGIDHISVDYDGRQEAVELDRERQSQHQKEQEIMEQQELESVKEKSRRKKQRKRPWNISGAQVQSYSMDDGRTTVHITSDGENYADERITDTPMIFNAASSMSGTSYQDDGHDLRSHPSPRYDYIDVSNARYPTEGQRRPLPSMSRGGAEFGTGQENEL